MNALYHAERLAALCAQQAEVLDRMTQALDDLNEIEAQARRMIADAPPYDGNDRRGK